ncbi:MAG: J domain-containing protein [Acidimicrobiia bacterium]
MSDFTDFYQVLGIDRKATDEQIKSAKKKLNLQWHPDRVTDAAMRAEYGEKCKLVNEAAQTLLKDRLRYDAKLRYHEQADEREAADRAANAERARQAAASRAEQARRAAAAWAERERQAEAVRADRERREAADRAAREAVARRKRIRDRVIRVAIAAWAVVYLALTPTLVTTNLPFGWSDSAGNTFFTVAGVLVLAAALVLFGAMTNVFEFEVQSNRFRVAVGIVAGQGVSVFMLLVLAPLVALLWAVLKVVLLILAIVFVASILLS